MQLNRVKELLIGTELALSEIAGRRAKRLSERVFKASRGLVRRYRRRYGRSVATDAR